MVSYGWYLFEIFDRSPDDYVVYKHWLLLSNSQKDIQWNCMLKCISQISLINYTFHHFNTKCDRDYYNYYKMRQVLQTAVILWQNATVITKRDNKLLQCVTVITIREVIHLTIYFWIRKESNWWTFIVIRMKLCK